MLPDSVFTHPAVPLTALLLTALLLTALPLTALPLRDGPRMRSGARDATLEPVDHLGAEVHAIEA